MAANQFVPRKFKTKATVPPKPISMPSNLSFGSKEESRGVYAIPSGPVKPPAAPLAAPPPQGIPLRPLPAAVPIISPAPVAGGMVNLRDSLSASSAAPMPGRKIHRLQSAIQREKTATMMELQAIAPNLTDSHERIMQGQAELCRNQLQNYLEVCDSIAGDIWRAQDVIDVLHVLVRSLGLDVVSMVLFAGDATAGDGEMVSRGYRTPPNNEVRECWQRAVNATGRGINWQKLMAVSAEKDHALATWLTTENLSSYGYVPIRDYRLIHGFLLVGAHEKRPSAPLASGLLELAGGRLGLTLALRQADESATPAPPAPPAAVGEIRNQLGVIMGCFEAMRNDLKTSGATADLSPLLEQGSAAIAESFRLLARLASSADPGAKG